MTLRKLYSRWNALCCVQWIANTIWEMEANWSVLWFEILLLWQSIEHFPTSIMPRDDITVIAPLPSSMNANEVLQNRPPPARQNYLLPTRQRTRRSHAMVPDCGQKSFDRICSKMPCLRLGRISQLSILKYYTTSSIWRQIRLACQVLK